MSKGSSHVEYEIVVCEYDGWDYQFPITDPKRIKGLDKIVSDSKREISSNKDWIDVVIPEDLKEGYYGWTPIDDFILHMRPNNMESYNKNAYVGRFSYNPSTKEFLPSRISVSHSSTISKYANSIYNKFVRGIYYMDRETILLSPYYDPLDDKDEFSPYNGYDSVLDKEKMWATIYMLAKNGLKKNHKIITKANNTLVSEFDSHIHLRKP